MGLLYVVQTSDPYGAIPFCRPEFWSTKAVKSGCKPGSGCRPCERAQILPYRSAFLVLKLSVAAAATFGCCCQKWCDTKIEAILRYICQNKTLAKYNIYKWWAQILVDGAFHFHSFHICLNLSYCCRRKLWVIGELQAETRSELVNSCFGFQINTLYFQNKPSLKETYYGVYPTSKHSVWVPENVVWSC